jgi:transcription elongation factor Elf1
MVDGVEVPNGAIAADLSQQTPSFFQVRRFYRDKKFTCIDCGASEVWTAEEQKWYFEEIKAHPASKPVRCAECRKKRRQEKEAQRRHMEEVDEGRGR